MTFEKLEAAAITDSTIFLDIDGTLVPDGGLTIEPALAEKVRALSRDNDVYLASNAPDARTTRFAAELGVRAVPTLRKPLPHEAVRSIERRTHTLVIGDKFLTDGLFALVIGAEFIMLEPLRGDADSVALRLVYLADRVLGRVSAALALTRPLQWVKNLLVFAPLFFAGALFVPGAFTASVVAFVAFSIAASGVYVLNDLFDREQDRLHPKKKYRPLASGRMTASGAYALLAALALVEVAVVLAYPALGGIIALYVLVNGAYSAWFKRIALVDILCVASFYVMRVVAGGVATGIPLSLWIFSCVFFGALFIVVGKRRAEFHRATRRKVLDAYSARVLDFMLLGSASLAVLTYGLYSIFGHPSHYLVYSTVFVVLCLGRIINYLYTHPERAESPERLVFRDPWILGSFVLWVLYVFAIFYGAI